LCGRGDSDEFVLRRFDSFEVGRFKVFSKFRVFLRGAILLRRTFSCDTLLTSPPFAFGAGRFTVDAGFRDSILSRNCSRSPVFAPRIKIRLAFALTSDKFFLYFSRHCVDS
jgi:hypothetical protein